MRALILATALLATPLAAQAPVQPPQPQAITTEPDAQALPIARELLAVMFPPTQREQIFNAVMHAMITNLVSGARQGGGSDARANLVIDKYVADVESDSREALQQNMPGLFEAYARAYARHFSAEELRQIEVFAKTPAGAKFLQRSDFLLSDPDVARWQSDQFAAAMKRMGPKINKMQSDIAALKKSKGAEK